MAGHQLVHCAAQVDAAGDGEDQGGDLEDAVGHDARQVGQQGHPPDHEEGSQHPQKDAVGHKADRRQEQEGHE